MLRSEHADEANANLINSSFVRIFLCLVRSYDTECLNPIHSTPFDKTPQKNKEFKNGLYLQVNIFMDYVKLPYM